MTDRNMDDSGMLRLLRNEPERVYRALFDCWFSYVYTIVHGRLRSIAFWEEIEECVEDVFAELFLKPPTYTAADGSLRAYIGTVARRREVLF